MQVTYIPLVNQFNYDSIGGRVIVSALQSQNIDVIVDPIIYKIEKKETWEGFGLYYQSFFQNLWNHKYDGQLEKQIQNMADIVLISVNDFNYVYIIDKLLKAGKKVVIGGSTIQVRGYKEILDKLANYFKHDIMTLARNIIAVKGMVDLSTDLKSIIDNWRTVEITDNEFGTIYDCDYQWTKHAVSQFVFKFQCPWMKCEFCNRLCLPTINFTKNVSAEKIYNNFNKLAKEKSVRIVDDYFLFTPKIKDVLEGVNCSIEAQTGVRELTKRVYIENLNKHISKIKFGLESMMNYSLEAMNKEQDYKMILDMANAIIKYGDPEKLHIQPFWIVDSPQETGTSVRYNYDRLIILRQKFIDAGFLFSIYPAFMALRPGDKLAQSKYYGYEKEQEYLVGTSRIISKGKKLEHGLVRYDRAGNKLRSDMDIVDQEILDILFLDYLKHGYIK